MALEQDDYRFPEQASGISPLYDANQPPNDGGIFLPEPVYHAHGKLIVAGSELQYTVAATESSDPSQGVTGFVNGFSAFKSSSRGFRGAAAQQGDIIFSFGPVRDDKASKLNNILSPQTAQVMAVEAIYADLGSNKEFLKLPHAKEINLDRRKLIGHSMGGLALSRLRADEKIYLAACGFGTPKILQLARDVGKGGVKGLVTDFLPMLREEGFDSWAAVILKIAVHHRRPERTIGEIISCLSEDIREKVSNDTAETAYLDLEEDILVPANLNKANVVDRYGLMTGVGHCAPQHKSRETVMAIKSLRSQPPTPSAHQTKLAS